MRTKLVLWGTQGETEKVLIAIALNAAENKIDIWTFPEKVATEEFAKKMMQDWRHGKEVEMPEEKTHIERELSVTEGLLPDDLRVERGDVIQRAQTEWHFVVLSSKLNDVYRNELGELKSKIETLEGYSQDAWNDLKEFWNKVQEQVRDENLFREHANALRDDINALFTQLKGLRSKMDDEFRGRSKEHVEKFMSSLERIEEKITGGMRLQSIFEDLKQLQRRFRDTKLTRDHRSQVWDRLDKNFKAVKEKRFGSSNVSETSPTQRLQRRYEGLLGAIEKMTKSIDRDQGDLDFQKRKIETTDGQLEAQIRQAKIKMIEGRANSKRDKLKEMLQTKVELEEKIEKQKERDARRAEKQAREAAKVAAAEKIKSKIAEEVESRKEDAGKLEKAAEKITGKKDESMLSAVASTLGESLEDVVDTVKAVASVVGEKIGEAVEDMKEKAEELKEDATEVAEKVMAEVKEETAEAVEKAKEMVAEVKEEVAEEVAELKEDAVEAMDKAKEKLAEAKEEVAETVAEVKEEAAEIVEEAKETVTEVKEEVAEKVEEAKDAVTDKKEEKA